jgi:hypothetical protein
VGFVTGLGGGILSTLGAPEDAPENRAFVDRILRGEGEISLPDKGV